MDCMMSTIGRTSEGIEKKWHVSWKIPSNIYEILIPKIDFLVEVTLKQSLPKIDVM